MKKQAADDETRQKVVESPEMEGSGVEDSGISASEMRGSGAEASGAETSGASGSRAEAEKMAELVNDLQRTRADFENYRKQMDLQKQQIASFTEADTVKKVLPLLDDISRAVSVEEALRPLEKTLEKTLESLKLTRIDAGAGVEFNPDFHDAVMMEEGEGDKQVILEELRPGYLYNGAVIRPAMVKVTNG